MEYKFRAKAVHNGKWFYGAYFVHVKRQVCPIGDKLKPEDMQYLIIQDKFADWNMKKGMQVVDVYPETVGQFTGQYDKNGKEIYYGDRIKDSNGTIYNVSWDDRCSSFILLGQMCAFHHYFGEAFESKNCEVIGDIYEQGKGIEA